MYSRMIGFLLLAALVVGIAPAASPIASVSSSGNLEIRGMRFGAGGIPSWPLLQGDEIATTSAAAVISFSDKTRVKLAPNSRARLVGVGQQTQVQVLQGTYQLTSAPGSTVQVLNLGGQLQSPLKSPTTIRLNGKNNDNKDFSDDEGRKKPKQRSVSQCEDSDDDECRNGDDNNHHGDDNNSHGENNNGHGENNTKQGESKQH